MTSVKEWDPEPPWLDLMLVCGHDRHVLALTPVLTRELPSLSTRVHHGLEPTLADLLSSQTRRPDVALVDIDVDGEPDMEIIAALIEAAPSTPFVALTCEPDPDLTLEALAAGATDVLVKGNISASRVIGAVMNAVQRSAIVAERSRFEDLALGLLDAKEGPSCAVDRSGTVIATNSSWRQFCLSNGGSVSLTGQGMNYLEVCDKASAEPGLAGEHAAVIAKGLRDVLSGHQERFEHEYECSSPTEVRWFLARVAPVGERGGAVIAHEDVTSIKTAQKAVSHQATHDHLTGLYNRSKLISILGDELQASSAGHSQTGVAFINLDSFKRINDSFGHRVGDGIIAAVAERLTQRVRSRDTVARFSGDEFVVVWPGLDTIDQAENLAHRLETVFDGYFESADLRIAVSASIGVSVGRPPMTSDELILAADAAMLDAKSTARGRSRVFTEAIRNRSQARLKMETDLRNAISNEELELHYQPVIDMSRGQVVGAEALVRWNHPELGLVFPDQFIPVAESSGLVIPMGKWVLEAACRQAATMQSSGRPFQMGVNLSVLQVYHPDIIDTVQEALASSGLAPEHLMVEVTESVMMDDPDTATDALNQIAALGVSIAMDDFGTGYSSLMYLKRYPIDKIKIDRSFVSGMGDGSTSDDAIVTSIVGLAAAVGAVCVAEGVETSEQRHALLALGCRHAQGFFFSRPVPARSLATAIERSEALFPQASDTVPEQGSSHSSASVSRIAG
ncbi:MAG: GGDEF domain-containing response regulator [Actinomycetes bacterium]